MRQAFRDTLYVGVAVLAAALVLLLRGNSLACE